MSVDEYETACQAVPGYTARARTARLLHTKLTELRRTVVQPNIGVRFTLAGQLVAALNDGAHLPDDPNNFAWGPEWRDSMHFAEHQNLLAIVTEATQRADDALGQHLTQHADTALAHLDSRLQELLAQARGDGPTEDAVQTYIGIRQAQQRITIDALNPGPSSLRGNIQPTLDLLRVGGEMADRFEQWPRWSKGGKPGKYQPDERPPWPTGGDINKIELTPAYAQWALGSSARLWVPTIPQLKAAARREQQLFEARDMHAQEIRNGYAPPSRWTIPDQLSADTLTTEGLAHV